MTTTPVSETASHKVRPADHERARQVVVCGSMGALSVMRELGVTLARAGLATVVPSPDVFPDVTNPDEMRLVKRTASLAHMASIKDERTVAVVVANVDRYGHRDYVGPNAFAEIAVAVSEAREAILLYGMPDNLRDELDAWHVRCFHGDVRAVVRHLAPATPGRPNPGRQCQSEELFPVLNRSAM